MQYFSDMREHDNRVNGAKSANRRNYVGANLKAGVVNSDEQDIKIILLGKKLVVVLVLVQGACYLLSDKVIAVR